MCSIRFSIQKSFHSFKTKGVRMSRQDNATFVEQSLSTEVVSHFYLP